MASEDERHMAEALALAARGRGAVEPNPMVGALVVRDGVVLGSGWHRRFGGPHAEVEALADARRRGGDVRGATVYVTLEPCCRAGSGKKTPPCTEALVAAGVGRVVAAMEDPDEHVRGRGLARLRQAGIEVACGVQEAAARKLLRAYVKLRTMGRPWVIAKWAQTGDGYLALPAGQGRWISCEESRRLAHELRGQCDGVLVGIGTVLADDPLLTNRSGAGRQPARVVLDAALRIPPHSRLVRTAGGSPLIVATAPPAAAAGGRIEELRRAGAEVLALPPDEAGVSLPALLDELGRRQWTHLLVEGGAAVLRSFLSAGLADEVVVFISPAVVGAAAGLPRLDIKDVAVAMHLPEPEERRPVGPDEMVRYSLGDRAQGGTGKTNGAGKTKHAGPRGG